MCHTVYCPHSRLSCNDVINILAGPLKRRLVGLICIAYPTGCMNSTCLIHCGVDTLQPIVQPAVQLVVRQFVMCKHRVRTQCAMHAIGHCKRLNHYFSKSERGETVARPNLCFAKLLEFVRKAVVVSAL